MNKQGQYRPRLSKQENDLILKHRDKSIENVLVIGDIHAPFELKGYLQFCKDMYKEHNCNRVVFIGDLIDNHYSSYHETDADGIGGKAELKLAIKSIKKWYKAFPNADVTIGNHDRIIMRKAQSSNIPSEWIKSFSEVLNTPNWNYVTEVIYNKVRYVHGDKSSSAKTSYKRDLISTVSGHFHTQFFCEWGFGKFSALFGMQVGCGIDSKSYAMGYMQGGKKEAIGCGVVLNNGTLPFVIPMDLEKYK